MLGAVKRALIRRHPIAEERLRLLRQMPQQSICAEIGVYQGQFSSAILKITKPRELHLIDAWKFISDPAYSRSWFGGRIGQSQATMDRIYRRVTKQFADEIAAGTVKIHRKLSADAAASFPDHYFDWVYIDADHTYEAVSQDLHAFYPKLRDAGFVAGDNYGYRPDWWWKDGVKRAVDEFVAEGWCDAPQISNDQFVMQKKTESVSSWFPEMA